MGNRNRKALHARQTVSKFSPMKMAVAMRDGEVDTATAAFAVGVTPRTIENWLAGKGEPSATKLAHLATVTKHYLGDFFTK